MGKIEGRNLFSKSGPTINNETELGDWLVVNNNFERIGRNTFQYKDNRDVITVHFNKQVTIIIADGTNGGVIPTWEMIQTRDLSFDPEQQAWFYTELLQTILGKF